MLISPPILLPHNPGETDDQWIARCMTGDAPGRGAYPISHNLEWHGGLHLTAPRNGSVPASIRAIADGKVIFWRDRKVVSASDEDHPLNYFTGYTSDACVIIEHTTEIGEGADASVKFYSLYLHLTDISDKIKLNKPIWRKDLIAHAGHIYGEKDRFHFEICCDDANLKKLIGRATGQLQTAANGRTDAVFGEMYFTVPAGAPVYAMQPVHYRSDGHRQPLKPSANAPWPAIVAQAAAYTTPADVIIGLRYGGGEGSAPGSAALTTYLPDGSTIGTPLIELNAEYNLYKSATDINKAWQTINATHAEQYPNVPAPSAIYELLRFGRIINTANETLTPKAAAHWRKVRYNGGEGWINLNGANVHQFSDADFPHWKGWQIIDDDSTATNSKFDSIKIRKMLDVNGDGTVTTAEAKTQLDNLTVQKRLKHTICKFPCEWEEAMLEARWSWLKIKSSENLNPFINSEYVKFKDHLKALCFSCPALFSAQWRFEPREFIKVFRRCGWFSDEEFAQCIPKSMLHLQLTQFHPSTVIWNTASNRAAQWSRSFNISTRKYGISNSKFRIIHFLSHVIPETGNLIYVKEIGGEKQIYSPYFGRGLIQLTHLENYKVYGNFNNFSRRYPSITFPALGWDPNTLIATDNNGHHNTNNCADSACFYVIQRKNMLSHLDHGIEQDNAITASKDVNGYVAIENLNGLDIRLQSVAYLNNLLLDRIITSNTISITFTWRRKSQQEEVLDSNGHPVMSGNPPQKKMKFYVMQHTIAASLERQKP